MPLLKAKLLFLPRQKFMRPSYVTITKLRKKDAKISPNCFLCSYKFFDVLTPNIIHHRLIEINIMCHVHIFRLIGRFQKFDTILCDNRA